MLALVGLTVARMGQINELYGYAAGDRVLATLGGVLASSSRAEDLPARLEGDRFCLVLNARPRSMPAPPPSALAFCSAIPRSLQARAAHPDRA